MADSKLADLTEVTTLGGDELVYVVDDPAGTPVDRKITAANLLKPAAPSTQSGTTYTLTATDASDVIRFTNASAVTVTIPTDASEDLADGFEVVLFAEGAGGLTLSTTGITLAGSSPNTTISQNEGLFLKKTATADTWVVMGGTA